LRLDAKHTQVSLGISKVTFGSHCLASQKSIVVKQCISVLEPIVEEGWDLRMPIVARQWDLGTL
jgi:hypothetical protein